MIMRNAISLCLVAFFWIGVAPAALLTEVSLSYSGTLLTEDESEALESFGASCNTNPCADEWTLANGDTVMYGTAVATARYGSVSAYTNSFSDANNYSNSYGPYDATYLTGDGHASASGGFQDAITLSGRSGTGLLHFILSIDLIVRDVDIAGRFAGRFGSTVVNPDQEPPRIEGTDYFQVTIPFTFGAPVPFGFTVSGNSNFISGGTYMESGGDATLIGIRVLDAQGVPLTGPITYLTDSGTRYAVPEPATGALLGLCLCGVVWAKRQRQK